MEPADLFLQATNLVGNMLEVIRVFETVGAAIWGVEASKVEVATPLAWCLAVAFDFASFTFVTAGVSKDFVVG